MSSNGSITIDQLNTLLPDAVLLPIPERQKGPKLANWQRVTLAASREPTYRQTLVEHRNTGVLLGRPSSNLCAIDIDSDEDIDVLLALNPPFRNTLQSRGKRGCQFWICVDGDYPHSVIKLKDHPGRPFGEWRADGGQSVIRGVHPDGVHYRIVCDAAPLRIRFEDIRWPLGLSLPWKNSPQTVEPSTNRPAAEAGLSDRIRAYLIKVEPASQNIEVGSGGGTAFGQGPVLMNSSGFTALEPLDESPDDTGAADIIAKKHARNKNKHRHRSELEMMGNLKIVAANNYNFVGFGNFDGKWICEKVIHRVGKEGFITRAEFRRCLVGY